MKKLFMVHWDAGHMAVFADTKEHALDVMPQTILDMWNIPIKSSYRGPLKITRVEEVEAVTQDAKN
jgi:hypothetical protein